jgi:hypothetical protein
MELVVGTKKFTVKPHLIARCGDTDNVGFGAYQDDKLVKEFVDLQDMGYWITGIIVDETLYEELVES